jgi:hypothetical protein
MTIGRMAVTDRVGLAAGDAGMPRVAVEYTGGMRVALRVGDVGLEADVAVWFVAQPSMSADRRKHAILYLNMTHLTG